MTSRCPSSAPASSEVLALPVVLLHQRALALGQPIDRRSQPRRQPAGVQLLRRRRRLAAGIEALLVAHRLERRQVHRPDRGHRLAQRRQRRRPRRGRAAALGSRRLALAPVLEVIARGAQRDELGPRPAGQGGRPPQPVDDRALDPVPRERRERRPARRVVARGGLREARVRERHQLLELDVAADPRIDRPAARRESSRWLSTSFCTRSDWSTAGGRYRNAAVADTVRAWACSPSSATRSSAPSPPGSRSAPCAPSGPSPRARSTRTSTSRPIAAAGSSASTRARPRPTSRGRPASSTCSPRAGCPRRRRCTPPTAAPYAPLPGAPLPGAPLPGAPLPGAAGKWVSVFPWRVGGHLAPAEVTEAHAGALGQAARHAARARRRAAARVAPHQHLRSRSPGRALPRLRREPGSPARARDRDPRRGARGRRGRRPGASRRHRRDHPRRSVPRQRAVGRAGGRASPRGHPRLRAGLRWQLRVRPRGLPQRLVLEPRGRGAARGARPRAPGRLPGPAPAARRRPRGAARRARAAAARFTITRITDVYLARVDNPDKDFRAFLARCEAWRGESLGQVTALL